MRSVPVIVKQDKMINLVELIAEEGGVDQSCVYGNRVENHAVYCHSNYKGAPRKCRRTWYTGSKVRDGDCPFYRLNPGHNNDKSQ